jgi:7-carboxy-7-deazaguanine synthase
VTEVFESLQGEGPFCCRRALFVRLAGCNLRCPFCDTKYSLDPRAGRPMGAVELLGRARGHWLVVVTGGEPLLQRSALEAFTRLIAEESPGTLVQVETNGTLPAPDPAGEPGLASAAYVVSPKDFPVQVPGARTHPSWFTAAREGREVYFKLLARGDRDVERIAGWVEEHRVPRERVYVMPLTGDGTGPGELLERHREVARAALRHGLNFSPRMHLLLGLA